MSVRFEWCAFHDPFEKGFDLDIETRIGGLIGNDTINGGVGETGSLGQILDSVFWCVFGVADKACKGVGGTDGVFAGDNGHWIGGCTFVDTFGNNGGDEFEDVWADSAGNLERSIDQLKSWRELLRGKLGDSNIQCRLPKFP